MTEKMRRSIKRWHMQTEPLPQKRSACGNWAAWALEEDMIHFNFNTVQLKHQDLEGAKFFFGRWSNHF